MDLYRRELAVEIDIGNTCPSDESFQFGKKVVTWYRP
jgi:hypothetical protein